ncbi:MAG: restriction endonuclease subunit S [Sphingobacteriales bacterium]|nr:restriction endonuclease subunit S [Sphingobacteriales bacterium]
MVSFLNSDFGQLQLERVSSGSILQSIRSSDLRKIKVILPPIEIQNQIGEKIKKSVLAKAESRKNIEDANLDIQKLV